MIPHQLENIFHQLTDDTIILTPNRRLAATLHQLYQSYQMQANLTVWKTPHFLPLNTWLQQLWNKYTYQHIDSHPLLLSTTQEMYIWEKIISQSNEHAVLLQISETAKMAKAAWGLLKQWQISVDHPAFQYSEDYTAFQHWCQHFEIHCNKNNYIDQASLPDFLIQEINHIPEKIYLYGFNDLSPQLHCFFKTAINITSEINNDDQHRIPFYDQEQEIYTLARWAKAISTTHHHAKIGCVIPSLDKIRDRVEQIFSESFAESGSYTVSKNTLPFNISAGKPLATYPIIAAALTILSLQNKNISIEKIYSLLTSPFIGESETEYLRRALYDTKLRQENIESIDIEHLLNSTSDSRISINKNCPALAKRLAKFSSYLNSIENKNSFKQWANIFNELVAIMGWPGERSINSEEYQVVEEWIKLLEDNLTTLDVISDTVTFSVALKTLQRLANTVSFQPKSPETNIQVLGILEAAGIAFDYLWVSGMDDLSWPPQPKPNPFIPKHLQRELNMPHATAERELTYCRYVTQQFISHSQNIIFSHALKNDEIELQCSPLIRHIKEMTVEQLTLLPFEYLINQIYQSRYLETLTDDIAPSHEGNERVRGGVNVIRLQALCPFKAFAECRLHARELEKPVPGLRAKDRGTIIHQILQRFWNNVTDHSTLLTLTETQLSVLVSSVIDQVLLENRATSQQKTRYLTLEKMRLNELIHEWLKIEIARPPFKVIMSEQSTEISLNQLTLSVRIDRVDELPDKKKIIIDYKTGKNNQISNWFGDRPEEPQLPLYCLIDPAMTASIAFAQIYPGDFSMKGISQYSLEINGIKNISDLKNDPPITWDKKINEWKTILTNLSDDFYHGHAHVDPKDKNETCLWCQIKPFCRIYEEVITT